MRRLLIFGAVVAAVVVVAAVAIRTRGGDGTVQQPDATATPERGRLPTPDAQTARVLRVVDGDTIVVDLGGRRENVRYIGVDTPETVAPNRPVECFGREASAENKRLVDGKTVRLERDVSDRDRYGRLLRYVYLDDRMVNEELVRQGFATAVTYQPDVRENARFRQLERDARRENRGLWGSCQL